MHLFTNFESVLKLVLFNDAQEEEQFAGLDLARLRVELGPHNQATLANADLLIMSPGVNPAQTEIAAALEAVSAKAFLYLRSLIFRQNDVRIGVHVAHSGTRLADRACFVFWQSVEEITFVMQGTSQHGL